MKELKRRNQTKKAIYVFGEIRRDKHTSLIMAVNEDKLKVIIGVSDVTSDGRILVPDSKSRVKISFRHAMKLWGLFQYSQELLDGNLPEKAVFRTFKKDAATRFVLSIDEKCKQVTIGLIPFTRKTPRRMPPDTERKVVISSVEIGKLICFLCDLSEFIGNMGVYATRGRTSLEKMHNIRSSDHAYKQLRSCELRFCPPLYHFGRLGARRMGFKV